jgi:hypothetical protein
VLSSETKEARDQLDTIEQQFTLLREKYALLPLY